MYISYYEYIYLHVSYREKNMCYEKAQDDSQRIEVESRRLWTIPECFPATAAVPRVTPSDIGVPASLDDCDRDQRAYRLFREQFKAGASAPYDLEPFLVVNIQSIQTGDRHFDQHHRGLRSAEVTTFTSYQKHARRVSNGQIQRMDTVR